MEYFICHYAVFIKVNEEFYEAVWGDGDYGPRSCPAEYSPRSTNTYETDHYVRRDRSFKYLSQAIKEVGLPTRFWSEDWHILERLGCYEPLLRQKEISYIRITKEGVSFLPISAVRVESGKDFWNCAQRQTMSYGKFIKKWTGKPDKEVEQAVNILKSVYTCEGEFEITDKVALHYREENSAPVGTLGSSCMRHAACQKYLGFYERNGVQLLVYKHDGLVLGRALIWDMGVPVIDRVYGSEAVQQCFKDYALEHKMWIRAHNSAGWSAFISPEGETMEKEFKYQLTDPSGPYPYVDTFCFGDLNKTYLTNISADCKIEYQSISGECQYRGIY